VTLVTATRLREVLDLPESVGDPELVAVCEAVDGALLPLLDPGDHTTHPHCVEAALGIAVQIWQARSAPGGQLVGSDLGPITSPHLLGPGLITRFGGLLAPCLPVVIA
jgi:hypothetical protein